MYVLYPLIYASLLYSADMAPEVFNRGDEEVRHYAVEADIFSSGIILYELHYGQHPHQALHNAGGNSRFMQYSLTWCRFRTTASSPDRRHGIPFTKEVNSIPSFEPVARLT